MKVEKVKCETLNFDPANARQHSSRNIETIQKSLMQFGQRKPVVVWKDTVIAGNGTLRAAMSLGWVDIEITRVPDDWTKSQITAYAVADNRTSDLASWDEEVLLDILADLDGHDLIAASGFTEEEIDDLRAFVEEAMPDVTHPLNVTSLPGIADLAERYANKATRQLVSDYPNHVFVWVVERLGKLRIERDFDSNSQAIVYLLEKFYGEAAPEWTTES